MLTSSLPLGRIGGIPLRAHWSVVIVLGLLAWLLATQVLPATAPAHAPAAYWVTAAVTAAGFLASLLAHELTHAFVARRHHIPVKNITLWMLGGVTQMEAPDDDPGTELRVAVSGPVTSLVIGGACLGVTALGGAVLPALVSAGLAWLGLTNLVLGVFNLLPGAPLDGGRVLRALVWRRTGDRARAVAVAAGAGRLLGGAMIGLGLAEVLLTGQFAGLWLGLLGWFVVGAAQVEAASDMTRARLAGIPLREIMDPQPVTAAGWWTVATFVERTAVHTRQRTFPVVSFDGHPQGVVNLQLLARLTPQQRITMRVADVARPARQAGPGEAVTDVLASGALRRPGDVVLVVDNGATIGLVSAEDLQRTVELAALDARPVAV